MPKTATSTAHVPVLVNWKCSHCGCENSQPHTLQFQASTEATLLANDEKLKAKAREKLQASLPAQMDAIVKGGYDKAKLNLACKQCSQKELWSQYKAIPNWVFISFIVGLILLVADSYIIKTGTLAGIGAFVAFVPLIIMAIYTSVYNKRLNKRAMALPEENKPHFYVVNK